MRRRLIDFRYFIRAGASEGPASMLECSEYIKRCPVGNIPTNSATFLTERSVQPFGRANWRRVHYNLTNGQMQPALALNKKGITQQSSANF